MIFRDLSPSGILGSAGAVVGGSLGGFQGAVAGYNIGSSLGGFFEPRKKITNEQASLNGIKNVGVGDGADVPFLIGSAPVGGVVLWVSAMRETQHSKKTKEGGKKGGTKTVTVTKTYDIDAFIKLSDNEGSSLGRVWRNGELVANFRADAPDAPAWATTASENWERITFYGGAADQMPDPTYEAAVGVGKAPAYRGCSTVFIEGLQLGYSDQLPQLKFELITDDTVAIGEMTVSEVVVRLLNRTGLDAAQYDVTDLERMPPLHSEDYTTVPCPQDLTNHIQDLGDVPSLDALFPVDVGCASTYEISLTGADRENSLTAEDIALITGTTSQPELSNLIADFIAQGKLPEVNTKLYNEGWQVQRTYEYQYRSQDNVSWMGFRTFGIPSQTNGETLDPNGHLIMNDGSCGYEAWANFAPNPLSAGGYYLTVDDPTITIVDGYPSVTYDASSSAYRDWYNQINSSLPNSITRLSDGSTYIKSGYNNPTFRISNCGAEDYENVLPSTQISMWYVKSDQPSKYARVYVNGWLGDSSGFNGALYATRKSKVVPSNQDISGYFVDGVYDNNNSNLPTNGDYSQLVSLPIHRGVAPYSQNGNDSVYNPYPSNSSIPSNNARTYFLRKTISNKAGTRIWVSVSDLMYTEPSFQMYSPDAAGPITKNEDSGYGVTGIQHSMSFIANKDNVTIYFKVPFDNSSTNRYFNIEIWKNTETVVTTYEPYAVVTTTLHRGQRKTSGIFSMGETTVRSMLEILSTAYFFDCYVNDGKIKFKVRGGEARNEIGYLEIIDDGRGTGLVTQIGSDIEIPAKVQVSTLDFLNDFNKVTAISDRIISESATTTKSIDLPMSMRAGEAKGIADTIIFDAAVARTGLSISVLGKYAALMPTDVVIVTDSDGSTYRMRVVRIIDEFPRIKLDLIADDASVLKQYTATTQITSSMAPKYYEPSRLELLDIPIISDADDNYGFYAAIVRDGDGTGYWSGAGLFDSDTVNNFTQKEAFDTGAIIGDCTTILGDWTQGRLFDNDNTVTVTVKGGTLANATRDDILNSRYTNLCLVGNEILQFKTATLVSAGVYTLSGLLRGGRGTEWAQTGHVADERFVMLYNTGTERIDQEMYYLGLLRYYKGVSVGWSESDVAYESFRNNGVGKKPFAPTFLHGYQDVNGDIIIKWIRRTRLQTRTTGALGVSIPLGEASEQYQIEIKTGALSPTPRRTVNVSGATEYNYTTAQQVADGGACEQIYVTIKQVSDVVGLGLGLSGVVK